MRMSDWSSDVCSSDLTDRFGFVCGYTLVADDHRLRPTHADQARQEPRHTTIRAEPDHSISSGKMRRSRGPHHVTTDRENYTSTCRRPIHQYEQALCTTQQSFNRHLPRSRQFAKIQEPLNTCFL